MFLANHHRILHKITPASREITIKEIPTTCCEHYTQCQIEINSETEYSVFTSFPYTTLWVKFSGIK